MSKARGRRIISGNISSLLKARGWFMGQFVRSPRAFHNRDFEAKWSEHRAGERSKWPKKNKVAKTLTILIRGKIIMGLPDRNVFLKKEGDFVYFDAGVFHTFNTEEDSLALVIRWPSISSRKDQVRQAEPGSR